MEKEIVIIEEGALSDAQIEKLESKGYTVIVATDASKIKLLSQMPRLNDSEVLEAALSTLNHSLLSSAESSKIKAVFGEKLISIYARKLKQ